MLDNDLILSQEFNNSEPEKVAGKQILLTNEGLKEREDELHFLKTVMRKDIAEKIKEARGQGDLSENAEYDAAKEEQAEIEARIVTLEKMLRNAKVIDEDDLELGKVGVGSKVVVYDYEFDEEIEYHIIGSAESDPEKNKISNESPLGMALLGQEAGQDVLVDAPAGELKFKIIEVI